jgi:hypothetical protein
MKTLALCLCTFFFCISSVVTYAADDIKDSSTGETFPSRVSFEHDGKQYKLNTTGVATRKKFFVKVYSIASYLQEGVTPSGSSTLDKVQAILNDQNAKQLTFKWVHDVSAAKVQEAFNESLKSAIPEADYAQLQGDVNKFLQFYNQEVHKGDEHFLRWLPGGYIEVILNGKKAGSITNTELAKGLWSIWFGPKSVVDRDSLLSSLK